MKKLIPFLALAWLITSCSPDSAFIPENEPEAPENISAEDLESQMLLSVNDIRQQGCTCGSEYMPPVAPLKWSSYLQQAAERHALDMATNDFFSHTGSDGSNSAKRIEQTGYQWRAVGENIGYGYLDMEDVMDAWLSSPGHCKNIMNANFTEIGAAELDGYWVQNFARPE